MNPLWDRIGFNLIGTCYTLKGHSIASIHTCFYIPELDIMLDAGMESKYFPEKTFVTHGHMDHSLYLPATFVELSNRKNLHDKQKKPTIFVPSKMFKPTLNYIYSSYALSKNNPHHRMMKAFQLVGVDGGKRIEMVIKNNKWIVEVIECDHTVPCVGYGFIQVRRKVKDEYMDLPKQRYGELKKEGIEFAEEREFPIFCYLGDSTAKVFENFDYAKYPNIICECTYINSDDDKEKTNKHTHWEELEPIIRSHPDNMFILYHFSQRYSSVEIYAFFDKMGCPNLFPWIEKPTEDEIEKN